MKKTVVVLCAVVMTSGTQTSAISDGFWSGFAKGWNQTTNRRKNSNEMFRVSATRKSDNLYEIDFGKFFIKTQHCLEPAYFDDVIIDRSGFGEGDVIFIRNGGNRCRIVSIFQ